MRAHGARAASMRPCSITRPRPPLFPTALAQEAMAIALIKQHAAQWNVDPDRIFVSGYSAGGHLAASIGVFWNRPFLHELTRLSPDDMRPAGLVLAYPVITSGEYAHAGSMRNLLGEKYGDAALTELVSLEKQVSAETPPTFIWSTVTDAVVPWRTRSCSRVRCSGTKLTMNCTSIRAVRTGSRL